MKRFLKKVMLFCVIFFATVIIVVGIDIIIIGDQYLGNYQASIIDKVNRFQSIQSPKIILIGNSNVDFGMRSDLIEAEFGMPVVDMGLHGGLGNAFHENMVRLGISPGDIVILIHSNYSDDDSISEPELAWITLEHHYNLWKILRTKDLLSIMKAFPTYFAKSCFFKLTGEKGNTPLTDTSYSRSAFNEYGDIVVRTEDRYTFTSTSITVPEINSICTNRINKLNEYVISQGATLLIASYPIAAGEFTPEKELYTEFEKLLRGSVDCEVISHFTDYFFPYDLFYDTHLHLTDEGSIVRTKQLISDLHVWMNGQ